MSETPDPIEEIIARAICDAWGYAWDGDPDEDHGVVPDIDDVHEERPCKQFLREAAQKIIAAHLAALEAAGYEVVRKQEPNDGRD